MEDRNRFGNDRIGFRFNGIQQRLKSNINTYGPKTLELFETKNNLINPEISPKKVTPLEKFKKITSLMIPKSASFRIKTQKKMRPSSTYQSITTDLLPQFVTPNLTLTQVNIREKNYHSFLPQQNSHRSERDLIRTYFEKYYKPNQQFPNASPSPIKNLSSQMTTSACLQQQENGLVVVVKRNPIIRQPSTALTKKRKLSTAINFLPGSSPSSLNSLQQINRSQQGAIHDKYNKTLQKYSIFEKIRENKQQQPLNTLTSRQCYTSHLKANPRKLKETFKPQLYNNDLKPWESTPDDQISLLPF